jgi:heterodisulfide reductase subunit B
MSIQQTNKLEQIEKDLEAYINAIEESVISGDYGKAFRSTQKAKALVHIVKIEKLWEKGNRYFAIIDAVKQARNALKKRNSRELEGALERVETLIRG